MKWGRALLLLLRLSQVRSILFIALGVGRTLSLFFMIVFFLVFFVVAIFAELFGQLGDLVLRLR